MKKFRPILNLLLSIGVVLVFNESDTFIPNLIGLTCLALLIWLNKGTEESEEVL